MKKLLAPIMLLTVIVSLLSSCSGPSAIALTKRHYRSGYYVDWGNKKNIVKNQAIAKISAKSEPKIVPLTFTQPEKYVALITTVPISAKLKTTERNKALKQVSVLAGKAVTQDLQDQTINTINDRVINSTENTLNHNDQVNANVAFVVIVLCAIFIPPLGVGLMYGIHGYFWIDLILTLIFFFPGMIFALIVVLT
jgi:uncharacterized membrane protein YqaE (UPF0057 family)